MPEIEDISVETSSGLDLLFQAAKHDNGLFQTVLNCLPMPYLLVNTFERVVQTNQACLDMLGIDGPVESCYGKTLAEVFYNDTARKTVVRQSIDVGTVFRDIQVPTKNHRGKKLHIIANVFPIYDADNVCAGGMCIYVDHTDRKRIEDALEKRIVALTRPIDDPGGISFDDLFRLDDIQRLQDDFSTVSGVASIITQPDGTPITKPSNFCRLCNDIIRKTEKGYVNCTRSDSQIGMYSELGPTVQTCMSGGLWDAGAGISVGGKHVANWLIGQVRDATQNDNQVRAYAREIGVDENDVVEAFLEVPAMDHERFKAVAQAMFTLANQLSSIAYQNVQQARFIADRKISEEQLIEMKERAESANRSKSEFLANMSHEIRTPLNGILGMLQLLETTEPNDEQKEYLLGAIRSTNRLTRLLSDVLDISRVEAGRLEIVEAEFNIKETRDSIQDIFDMEAREKGVRLDFGSDQNLPLVLIGDEVRLRQILFNLVGNAIKFTEKGEIRIDASVLPGSSDFFVRILVTVSDTGIGIPDEYLKDIFDPFVQAEGAYTRRFQGAGLGLSIVRRLVNLLGGEIAIDNTPGEGTTVYVSLPFKLPVANQTSAELTSDAPHPAHVSSRILIAEDDSISSLTCKRMLEKSNYSVTTAKDGQEALQRLTEQEFDLILMDIQMPVLNGVEATKAIRDASNLEEKSSIPIIAMTAYAMTGDKEKFFAAGMNDYIAKPVDKGALVEVIERVMAAKRNSQ